MNKDIFSDPIQPKEGYREASNLPHRHRIGAIWRAIFQLSTIVGILALSALIYKIVDQSFGYVLFEYKIPPGSLAVDGVALEELSKEDLLTVLEQNVSRGLWRNLNRNQPVANLSREEVFELINFYVLEQRVVKTWSLTDSVLKRQAIFVEAAREGPDTRPVFVNWIDAKFVTAPQNSDPLKTGVRTAILGSIWTIFITILFAFPLGVGAAIYLEEYAAGNWLNRVIQTNINNLAGVPSIIYGMLGLAIFVRALEPLTSGALFGFGDPAAANGRTILSAGLTLALLILPLLIINAQEAIRAVPNSLRSASYGLGATRWQTLWYHVLPNALPGILTGTILSVSRAIGETAPLVVVGAATYISLDPTGPFSKFTNLPIQIYQWTARPQDEFRNTAAAAIVVLMVLGLSLNAVAIFLRNKTTRRLS